MFCDYFFFLQNLELKPESCFLWQFSRRRHFFCCCSCSFFNCSFFAVNVDEKKKKKRHGVVFLKIVIIFTCFDVYFYDIFFLNDRGFLDAVANGATCRQTFKNKNQKMQRDVVCCFCLVLVYAAVLTYLELVLHLYQFVQGVFCWFIMVYNNALNSYS